MHYRLPNSEGPLFYSRVQCGTAHALGFAYGDVHRVASLCLAKRGYVCTPNALMLQRAWQDESFAEVLSEASLLVPDGVGACLALRAEGVHAARCTGVSLGLALARQAARRSLSLYIYGGHSGDAEASARALRHRVPSLRIAGTHGGYGDMAEGASHVRASGADIVFVCLGSPQQELFMYRYLPRSMLAVGLGGAADVYAHRMRRAPPLLQKTGTEWLYRLWREPHRRHALPQLLSFCLDVPLLLFKEPNSSGKEWLQTGKKLQN